MTAAWEVQFKFIVMLLMNFFSLEFGEGLVWEMFTEHDILQLYNIRECL